MSHEPPAPPPPASPIPVKSHAFRALAAKHLIDPRTLAKAARGEYVRGDAGRRAIEALAELARQ